MFRPSTIHRRRADVRSLRAESRGVWRSCSTQHEVAATLLEVQLGHRTARAAALGHRTARAAALGVDGKFSLNVRHHLDAVYDEVRDEAVNHYVGHKRPNKSSPAQIALTKLCACEILVVELSHIQS